MAFFLPETLHLITFLLVAMDNCLLMLLLVFVTLLDTLRNFYCRLSDVRQSGYITEP